MEKIRLQCYALTRNFLRVVFPAVSYNLLFYFFPHPLLTSCPPVSSLPHRSTELCFPWTPCRQEGEGTASLRGRDGARDVGKIHLQLKSLERLAAGSC